MKVLANFAFIPVSVFGVAVFGIICLVLVPLLLFMEGVTYNRWPWTVLKEAFEEEFYA